VEICKIRDNKEVLVSQIELDKPPDQEVKDIEDKFQMYKNMVKNKEIN
jgi:hypothetical protein